jgi:cytochrome bd-type quinol oxidase subunit 2
MAFLGIVPLIWGILAIFIGVAAEQRGRSGFGWFLVSLLLSPLMAGLLLALFPSLRDPRTEVDDAALEAAIRKGRLSR